MRRALSILKYVPAVVCGLLVVAWVVSDLLPCIVHIPFSRPIGTVQLEFWQGDITTCLTGNPSDSLAIRQRMNDCFGLFSPGHLEAGRDSRERLFFAIPFPLLLTLVVPVALVVYVRFPLWSYFAWTALLAAELAYYFR